MYYRFEVQGVGLYKWSRDQNFPYQTMPQELSEPTEGWWRISVYETYPNTCTFFTQGGWDMYHAAVDEWGEHAGDTWNHCAFIVKKLTQAQIEFEIIEMEEKDLPPVVYRDKFQVVCNLD
jgi:hypothetical protein